MLNKLSMLAGLMTLLGFTHVAMLNNIIDNIAHPVFCYCKKLLLFDCVANQCLEFTNATLYLYFISQILHIINFNQM